VPGAPTGGPLKPPTPFGDLMTDAVGEVNQLEDQAKSAVAGLMTLGRGRAPGDDCHQKRAWLLN